MKYLNFRIIQLVHGISINQTAHIQELVNTHIPIDSKIDPVNTPLRSDRQFSDEVVNSIPATASELKKLEIEF